jgi:hemoglobin
MLSLATPWAGCAGKSDQPRDPRSSRSTPGEQRDAPHRPQTRPAAARTGSLFDRLGGEKAVRKVVDDFVSRAAADPAVNFTRQGHATTWEATPQNVEQLKQRLVEFISTTAGGPTTFQYRGKDMVTAHRGMGISNAEFDALAGHLKAALEANDVPRRESEELLNAVGSTRGAIVEAAEQPAP